MNSGILRVHHFELFSRVNGPGLRFVLWVQGCSLGCPGCFNPMTHPANQGRKVTVQSLVSQVIKIQSQIEGITISGGEPLQQIAPVVLFLKYIKEQTSLSTLLFTGFSMSEIQRMPSAGLLLQNLDVLLAGRYQQDLHLGRGLIGSANKTVQFLTGRYASPDLLGIPEAEVIVATDGTLTFSGIDPLL